MRLKRLEIYGFKTFPDKAAIEFPPGISAVVGPNGCGKSNIFDAIKWVMGEQSIKQLRGKSMGDVIFAGSEKRAPVNFAEVSLILTNDNTGEAPPIHPYPEIMITRRLYRSGESAYLLNKQPCRLKDIHNIFLGSGMGSKSCAIVQQGNIGAITDATAEERRSFIEEAAGVMRYKSRKKEALAKVETTRRNLDRLDDIIDEISQQVRDLSAQAETARQYKERKARLKEVDILVAVHYYSRYAGEIASVESQLQAISQKDADQNTVLDDLHSRIEEMRAELAEKEKNLAAKRDELNDRQRRIDRLEGDLDFREQEVERLTEELSDLEGSQRSLLEKNESLEAEILEEEQSGEQLKASIASVRSDMEAWARQSKDARDELDRLNETLQREQKQLMELSSHKARYQSICQSARANKDNLKKRLKRLVADEEKARLELEELTRREAEEKEHLETLVRKRSQMQEEIEELRASLSGKNEALGRQVKAVNTLRNDRSRLRSRHSALKKMEDNYEWYRDGVKHIMKNRASISGAPSDNTGIRGVLAEAVTPAEGFELALEACLGEALQFVLVDEEKTGISVIAYLKETDAGRCGVMVAEPPGGPVAEDETRERRDSQALLSHLTISEGFQPTIRRLLAGTLVAPDFDAALRMRSSRPDLPVVTMQGDLIKTDGAMIGGSPGKLTGIYEKKSELRELDTRISGLTEEIGRAEALQGGLEQEIRKIESGLHEMSGRKADLDRDISELEKGIYKTEEQLKHSGRQHEIICLEKERAEGEKQDIESEIDSHDTALASIQQEIAAAEGSIGQTKQSVADLTGHLASFDQQELDLKLALTRLQAELDSSRSTLKRLHRFSRESKEKIEETAAEIEIKAEKLHTAREALNHLSEDAEKERAVLAGLSEKVQLGEREQRMLSKELKSIDSSIARARQILSRNREERHRLELELSRLKLNQDNVVNRFLEQYAESFDGYLANYRHVVESPDFSIDYIESERTDCKRAIEALGDVNLGAIEAHENQVKRFEFFSTQREDLLRALDDLQRVISRISRITQELFMEAFGSINSQFQELFPRLFEGGKAWLELTQPKDPLETGVELMIQPPGKRLSRLSLLSGGEKALSAIAFIFSIFLINPAAYCLLDEIDAPLDEVNIHRFNELLKIIGENSQIIMITHNKKSMEFAEALYGITMGESGVSRIVSVDVQRLVEENRASRVSADNVMEQQ
jgi:chromosome segregation protein